ncbi:HD domain-containing protein|uniref:HDIG domain-containing protein n=1 Tax=Dendrosporobacter quercicolus TaxID=146817 RepID=A0A1G9QKL6_9FIRM|nr:HD domain-containing protein [Dendrosporobacter quercicolus]NSL48278.1 HD domain-containing protein [Dendrosporobacter quercicolus DSM 1736]SDM11574.1 HDIG domain-containing protein [Dendrosporobacter quercicolus]
MNLGWLIDKGVRDIKQARMILRAFSASGFQAYIVGGAVRDLLLGITPTDVDICTSAKPEEIMAVAARHGWNTEAVGAAFGSIMVIVNGQPYDVTTFRREEYGLDSHRPSKVEWGVRLEDDLSRRDFTINTLCIDGNGDIIDLFGGLQDLRHSIIRAVGDPCVRFAEDALRMFRAARFAAQLGFALDRSIYPAVAAHLQRVRGLSVERVRNEIERTLLAKYAGRGLTFMLTSGLLNQECRQRQAQRDSYTPILPELCHLYRLPQNSRYHHLDGWRHTVSAVEHIPANLTLRWAALLHDIGKGCPGIRGCNEAGQPTDYGHDKAGAAMAGVILKRLKVDREVAGRVVWLVANHMHGPQENLKSVVKWLRKRAKEFYSPEQLAQAIRQLFELYRADGLATRHKLNRRFTEMEQAVTDCLAALPFYPVQLAISGGDIASSLGAGPQVGELQKKFLERIQAGHLENTKEALLAALAIYCNRRQKIASRLE